jgi:hypothetical protein
MTKRPLSKIPAVPLREVHMQKKPNRTLISSLLMTVLYVMTLAPVATLPGVGWWCGAQVWIF